MNVKDKLVELLPFIIAVNLFIILAKYLFVDSQSLMRLIPIFFLVNFMIIIIANFVSLNISKSS